MVGLRIEEVAPQRKLNLFQKTELAVDRQLVQKNVQSAFEELAFYSEELWDILGLTPDTNVMVDEQGLEDLEDWMDKLEDP